MCRCRSVPAFLDAMLPSRNFGALLSGMAANERMTWAAGVFNDWIDTGDSISESSSQVVGRVTWLPFISKDESNLVHLGLGVRYTDAEEGIHFHTEPEFNQSPDFVDTSNFAADSAMTYNLEASWRKGPFWLGGEFMTTNVNSLDFRRSHFQRLSHQWFVGINRRNAPLSSTGRNNGQYSHQPVGLPGRMGLAGACSPLVGAGPDRRSYRWRASWRYSRLASTGRSHQRWRWVSITGISRPTVPVLPGIVMGLTRA